MDDIGNHIDRQGAGRRRFLRGAGLGVLGGTAYALAQSSSPAFAATVYDGTLRDQGGAVFNVRSSAYGASGNGSTDDTNPIRSAIAAANAAGGGTVYFPAGMYKVTSTIPVTRQGIRLAGASRNVAYISAAMAAGDVFQFPQSFGVVEDLSFVTSVNRTSGAYVSNNDGTSAGSYLIINRCTFDHGFDAINGDGTASNNPAQDLFVTNCNFFQFSHIGIDLGRAGNISNVYISGCEMTCSPAAQAQSGIYVGSIGSGVYISQVDLYSTGYGINISPRSSSSASDIVLDQVQCDTCRSDGLAANSYAANPGAIYGVFVTNSFFQGSDNVGFQAGYYGKVSGIQLTCCQFVNNKFAGLAIEQNSTQICVTGCIITGNSRGNLSGGAPVASGMNVAAGVTDLAVSGSLIGGSASAPWLNFPNQQKWGIWFAGAVTRVTLAGNSLSANASGKYSGLPAGAVEAGSC